MRAAWLACAFALCGCADDQVFVTGPLAYVKAARAAAETCGAKTMRIETNRKVARLIVGSDMPQPAVECIVSWTQAHEVTGSAITLKGGSPL